MIGASEKETYCEMVNIANVKMYLLFKQFNNPEADAVDFGNAYLHGFTKKKIYVMVGHGKSTPESIMEKSLITHHHYPIMC